MYGGGAEKDPNYVFSEDDAKDQNFKN